MDTVVLIAGGGPVGLSLAVRLALYAVPVVLVERRRRPSAFPKGRALSVRTMEIYRRWGLESIITAAGLPRDQLAFSTGSSLTDPGATRIVTNPAAHPVPSPTSTLLCSQDRLELLLRAEAERLAPGSVRFGTELVDLAAADDEVSATIQDDQGARHTVTARYLVAADGAHSGIRDRLGIGMAGPADVSHNLNILFEADLAGHVAGRESAVYTIRQPGLHGSFLAVDNRRRWLFNLVCDGADPGLANWDDSTCTAVIRAATGLPGLPVRLVDRRVWRASAQVADTYRRAPVFLAGDAAHVMTPYGGFGLNCGIADADNLAWKLAFVHHRRAAPGLLDTYEPERRPVALASAAESHRRLLDAIAGGPPRPQPSEGLTLGYHYTSAAVLDDGTRPPDADPVAGYVPCGRPGHRAPHAPIGGLRSTLDLVRTEMALLLGPAAAPPDAFSGTVARLDPESARQHGIAPGGAVLIRPDGHIAWRSVAGPAAAAVAAAATILGAAGTVNSSGGN